MIEKDKLDSIYTSTEQDLEEIFEQSPDILKVLEDNDGRVSIIHSKQDNVVHNYIIIDLKWSKSKSDKPFYPSLKCSTPQDYIDIDFTKDGYIVNAYNQKNHLLNDSSNKSKRIEEIMDISQRGMSFVETFRNIPMHLRADLRNKYIRKLDCKINDTPDSTLDCVSLTLEAINSFQRGELNEITE